MYNQIDQEECLILIISLAQAKGWWNDENEKEWLFRLDLIRWVFNTSYVAFKVETYKQKRGLPMGSPLSPVLANLFMAALEDATFKAAADSAMDLSYVKYYRYLDDILMIQEYDVHADLSEPLHPAKLVAEDILRNMSLLASESNINFEPTGEAWRPKEHVEYLDLKIMVSVNRLNKLFMLTTSVFDKPSNLHIYSDPSTFYPLHYIYG